MKPVKAPLLRSFALLAAAALCVSAAPAARRQNWNATITLTPSGSHVLGNPAARVKLTQYVSYTCSHCAQFEGESDARLRIGYVATGNVSVEVQHFIRDPVDMTVAMLANCGPTARFFLNHTAFMRSQSAWMGRLQSTTTAQRQRWYAGEAPVRFRAIASDLGFYQIMITRGYSRPEVDHCLADAALAQRLSDMAAAARRLGIDSTPSFAINGTLLAGTHEWRLLEPQIQARM